MKTLEKKKVKTQIQETENEKGKRGSKEQKEHKEGGKEYVNKC